jgi:serine/threonine protein kinase
MGRVYEAYDPILDRRIALKQIRGPSVPERHQRLTREAKALAKLGHPNVVTIFEVGVHESAVFLAMEFVAGGTLKDWIRENPAGDAVRRAEALRIIVAAGRGLVAAHKEGLIHRDVKPSNILIGSDGRVRVADFGIVRSNSLSEHSGSPHDAPETSHGGNASTEDLTRPGTTIGTPAYMAPEQLSNGQVTPAADQFAYAVTAWEVLFGSRPFDGFHPDERVRAVRQADLAHPVGATQDEELGSLLARALKYRPSARHESLEVLVNALERHASPAGEGGSRDRRSWRASALALLAVAGAASAVAVVPTSEAPCPRDKTQASLRKLWSPTARRQVAEVSGQNTADALDRFAKRLGDQRLATCEAHAISHTLSDEDLPLRSACLDRVEGRFSGLFQDVLQTPRELESTDGLLPSPDGCTDLQALRRLSNAYASKSAFDTVEQDAAMKDAERLLFRAHLRVNRSESPEPFVGELLELADGHKLYSMKAYALLIRAGMATDPSESEQLLKEVARIAEGSTNADLLSDLAAAQADLASRTGDLSLARTHLDHAATLATFGVVRTSSSDARDRELLSIRIDAELGETQGRAAALEDLLQELPPGTRRHLEATMLLADVLADRFEIQRAVDVYTEALAHPAADATSRHILRLNRAVTLVFGGRGDEALASLLEAEAKRDDEPPEDMRPARLLARAGAHRLQGELETARGEAETVAGLLSSIDPAHPSLGHVSHERALIELAAGDTKAALDHAIAAMGQWDAVHGPGSTDAGRALILVSWALRGVGRVDQAVAAAKTATEILTAKARPADEIAVARLAEDPTDTEAHNACASSELHLCRQALAVPASNALSP